jgi:hypothetical protein
MHRMFTLAFLALGLAVTAALPAGGRAYEPGVGRWVKLIFSPQAGYSSACLTCGWHSGACTSPSGGSALDFGGACTGSQQVYLRIFGFLPPGTPNNYVGYAHYSTPPAWDCKEVDALIRDTHGNLLGTMRYVHTENPWPQMVDLFASGETNGYLNEQPFVQMAGNEKPTCKTPYHDPPWWTGVHLHEVYDTTGTNTHIFLRDGGACAAGCGAYPCAPNPPDGSPCY